MSIRWDDPEEQQRLREAVAFRGPSVPGEPALRVLHTHSPSTGSVRVKVERNSRSINLEVAVDRPRLEGEDWDAAADAAVAIARRAYARALADLDWVKEGTA